MKSIPQAAPGDSAKASRAIGAMFFSGFGGIWLGLWAHAEYADSVGVLLLVAAVSAGLLAAAYRVYKVNAPALRALEETPEARRKSRWFNLINASQWGIIFLVALILSKTGHAKWSLPAVILIVGLHFLPLARLFAYRPHYLTGAGLILLACVYPLVARDGPENAVGALGAGLVLWISAVWAISSSSRSRAARTG
jgi:hypothetical protein